MLLLRRRLPASTSGGRAWLLEIEVDVPEIDPERLLAECEEFLVDGTDGRPIGVVDRVERSESTGAVSALIVSVRTGWLRHRCVRVDVRAIEALDPIDRRVIVDEAHVASVGNDGLS
jgi:sporulation protein YlmC with PRC-barrel domain